MSLQLPPPPFLSLSLSQLPMANSANVYVEQINEGLNRWAPSHARPCGENWMVEVNTHINLCVPQSTLGDDWD